jgi:hypothetical protein
MSGDMHDFNIIKTLAVVKFFSLKGKALQEIHAIPTETLGEHAPLYATVNNWVAQFNTFHPNGVYILRGLSSHQSGTL